MLLFILSITLTSTFGTVLFGLSIGLVWCAAFFDTFNVAKMDEYERRAHPDDWLWNTVDTGKYPANAGQQRMAGIVCIVLGAWLLLEQIPRLLNGIGINVWGIVGFVERYLPPVALALALIWLGLRFLSGRGFGGGSDPYRPVAPSQTDRTPPTAPPSIPRPQSPTYKAAAQRMADAAAKAAQSAMPKAAQPQAADRRPSLVMDGAQYAVPKVPVRPELVLEDTAPTDAPAAPQATEAAPLSDAEAVQPDAAQPQQPEMPQ